MNLIDKGQYPLRHFGYRIASNSSGDIGLPGQPSDPIVPTYKGRLTVRGVKFTLDGGAGVWGAAMLKNYTGAFFVICLHDRVVLYFALHCSDILATDKATDGGQLLYEASYDFPHAVQEWVDKGVVIWHL
jgi:hypothetical protein